MKREPDMDSAAYRDKKINEEYQQRINPKRPTEGELLNKEGVGEDGGFIDSGELAPDGTVQESSIENIESDIVKQKQLRDAQKNQPFDRAVEASDKAWKKGNLTARERIEQLLNAPNAAFKDLQAGAQGYNNQRQLGIDLAAQTADDVVTGALEKLNVPGSEYIGDRARNITGFLTDVVAPTAEDLALAGVATALATPAAGGVSLAALRMKKFGNEAVDFFTKIPTIISHQRGGRVGVKLVDGQFTERSNLSKIFMDDQLARQSAQPMMSKGKSNVTNLPPQGMSVRNNELFKNLGFEDWEKYFVGAWDDLADPISRNFNAAVSNDKYSWNTFDRVRRETLPLVMQEYAGIADIKWPRKGPELHHINAIKATMPLFEGLARNERKELLKVLMRDGIYAGHDPNNLMQLPHAVHKSVTKLWNDKIGKSGKLFFERDKDGLFKAAQLPFEERKILAKNYAKVVKDLELTTLKMAKDYKAISKDGLARKLDKELKTQFNIANFENFILTGKYLGDEVSPEVKQIFKSRSVKNRKRVLKKKIDE